MSEHLSLTQVHAYVRGALHPSTLVTIDDHLEACAACRAALARESDASFGAEAFGKALARAESRPESPHLAFEHFRGAVDGTLDAVDVEWVEEHIALCVMCAEELRDLERFSTAVPAKSPHAARPPEPSPTAEFEPQPAPPLLTPRRVVERTEPGEEPPPHFGQRPRERLPLWTWGLVAVSLAALGQLWAC